MTPEQVRIIVREVFDEFFPAYHRALTHAYWANDGAPGSDYTDANGSPTPPDVAVVAGIAAAVRMEHEVRPHAGGGHTHEATVTLA